MRNNMLMAAAKRADAAGAVTLAEAPVAAPVPAPVAVPVAPAVPAAPASSPTPGSVEARLRDAQTQIVGGVRVMEPTERLVPTVHLAVRIPKPTHSAIRTWATRVDMTIQEFVLSAVGELMQRLAAADEQQ